MNETMSMPEVKADSHLPRKIFHALAASVVPTVYWFEIIPRQWTMPGLAAITVVWVLFDVIRLLAPSLNRFFIETFTFLMKKRETSYPTGSSFMLTGTLLTMLLFDPKIATIALYFIALGDPAAAIVGKAYGKISLHSGRTLEGSATFFAVCCLVSFPFGIPLPALVAASLMAALAEAYSGRIDDNLSVPLLSGAVLLYAGVV